MQNVQVDHLRVQVRPELDVVVSALLYFFVQLSIKTLKGDYDCHVQVGEAAPIQSCVTR